MTKIKTAILLMLSVLLVLFVSVGSTLTTHADAGETLPIEETEEGAETNDEGFDELVAQFTAYLKDKYGADYEFYYNQINERWGSVEAYLMSFGEELPEEYQNAWQLFIGWLGEYAPIWATALAIIIVIIIAVVGKKQFNKIVEGIVNKKLRPIENELNLQSTAMISNLRAIKLLLPNNEKYTETAKELENAEKELKNG